MALGWTVQRLDFPRNVRFDKGTTGMNKSEERSVQIVLNAFDTLFNKRDYAAAERFWSPTTSSTARTFRPAVTGSLIL